MNKKYSTSDLLDIQFAILGIESRVIDIQTKICNMKIEAYEKGIEIDGEYIVNTFDPLFEQARRELNNTTYFSNLYLSFDTATFHEYSPSERAVIVKIGDALSETNNECKKTFDTLSAFLDE